MSANSDHLRTQIALVNKALGRVFATDPMQNDASMSRIVSTLDSAGTTDIRNLREVTNDTLHLQFFMDAVTGHAYLNPLTFGAYDPTNKRSVDLFDLFGDGRFNFYIYLKFTPDKFPVFVSLVEDTGNAYVGLLTGILFVAGAAVGAAFPALATTIGTAVMGAEAAAAYPAIATAIGQAAINTAFNGGDVSKGVVSALSGGIGGIAGGVVASATDSAIIGTAAAAATSAVIAGADPIRSVSQALVGYGVNSVGAMIQSPSIGANTMQVGDTSLLTTDPGSSLDFSSLYATDPNAGFAIDPNAGLNTTFDFSQMQSAAASFGTAYDFGGAAAPGDPFYDPNSPTNPPPTPSGTVATDSGVNLSNLALTALKLVGAWNQAGQPAIHAGNAQATANANGTITTRNANGTVGTARMPVGTPYLTASGSLVTNNGDGTYTSVNPNGSSSIGHYAASGVGTLGVSNSVLIGGAALAVFLLMKK